MSAKRKYGSVSAKNRRFSPTLLTFGCAFCGAPLYMLALSGLHVDLQGDFANCTLFALVLCSLFVPLYAVGKKHE